MTEENIKNSLTPKNNPSGSQHNLHDNEHNLQDNENNLQDNEHNLQDSLYDTTELEARIRSTSELAFIESSRMEGVLKKIGAGIVSHFSVSNLQDFIKHLIKVRSEFQNLESSLKTFLGSGLQAKEFMKDLQAYAIDNVFEFKDLAKVSTQLLAYSNDISTVIPILEKLSNIASGTNQPLTDLANLYNKAQSTGKLMTTDLQEWQLIGVPIVQQMAKEYKTTEAAIWDMAEAGNISFGNIEKILTELTSSGGMFFGTMKEKMGSLSGTVGQLNHSLTNMFNEIGEWSQDFIQGGLLTANTLVENYKEIGKVLLSLSIAYGSYRAAIILNTLATKGQTGIALIDNTVKQAKLALLKAEATLTGATAAAQNKMMAAELASITALKAKLTIQEREQLLNKLKTQTLQGILNTQQQQYLSNLKLTQGTQEYNRAAMEVLSVEQKQHLKKADLTKNGQGYLQLLKQEVEAKQQSSAASLAAMRVDVKAASALKNDLKQKAILAKQAVEVAQQEVSVAKKVGDATKIQRAEKNLLLATEQASITRKAALAANTDFLAKKKTLEAAVTRQSTIASNVDTVSKTAQSVATNILSAATNKAALAVRTLWTSMKTNPMGWVISLIGLAVSAFTMFSKKKEEEINISQKVKDQVDEETGSIGSLVRALDGAGDSMYLRKQIIEKLNPLLSKYNLELLNENDALSKISEQYKKVTQAIEGTTAARLKEQALKDIEKEANAKRDDILDNLSSSLQSKTKVNIIKDHRDIGGGVVTEIEYIGLNKFERAYVTNFLRSVSDKLKKLDLDSDIYKEESQKEIDKIISGLAEIKKKSVSDMQNLYNVKFNDTIKQLMQIDKEEKKKSDTLDNQAKIFNTRAPLPQESAAKGHKDYTKMALEELDRKAEDLKYKIKDLNEKNDPSKDTKNELKELQNNLAQINKITTGKELKLNTNAGIDKRIEQLKSLQHHTIIASKEYKDYTKRILSLEKLKGQATPTNEQTLKQQQELAQKQQEADLKLEQARIDIMDDGYQKRLAQAQFQHKQNIAAINKEEQDTKKAYESMGAKMPTEYTNNFAERRLNEEIALTKQTNELFTAELDYKKQQYELYYKWVEHLGEKAADNQFAELLKNGDSYNQYITNQIAALEQKKSTGQLTKAEANKLIGLNEHINALENKENPLEAFSRGLQDSLLAASNLAEELDIVLQKKKELQEGKSGIVNKDQLGAATRQLNSKQHEIEKQLQQKLLTDFKTYQEKKLSIEKEYQKLLELAEQTGNTQRAEQVKKQRDSELSALNASALMETDSWKNLFSDMDSLSVEAINKMVKDIEGQMANADLKLSPAEMKALLDRLDEAKAKIVEKNPFAALGYALTAIFKQGGQESEKTSAKIQSDWANLAAASKGSFSFISSIVSDSKTIKNLLGDSAEDLLNGLQDLDKAMQGVATLGSSLASGNTFGVIAGTVQLIIAAADFISGLLSGDNSKEKEIENLQKGVQSLQRDYERLGAAIQNTYTNQIFSLMNEQDANLRRQQEELKKMEEIEKDKKKSDPNKIQEFQNQQEAINQTLEENNRKRLEMLAGTDVKSAIDQFGDALVEAYIKGENAAEKLGEVTKQVMKKAVVDAIKRQFLAKGIQEATKYLGQAMSDGVLSESERQRFEDMVKAAGDRTQAALEATGGWLKDDEATKQDALTGAIKGVSEDTASVLAGRINQIALYQTDGLEIMRQALLYHAEVAANTRNIEITNATLKRIEDKLNTNPLLSQGIS